MRDFKGMKRQRGRNRSGGGGSSSSGGKPAQNVNRAFDSNGPDNVKIRGHAQHVYDKYCQLARDAASAGDRVLAENYLQHAEHYFRVLRVLQPSRPPSDITGRDVFASGFDIDVDEEADPDAMEPYEPQQQENEGGDGQSARDFQPREQSWNQQGRDNQNPPRDTQQPRDNFQRDRNENRDRNGNRDRYESRDRNRDDRPRDDRPREERQPRDDRPRDDRPRDDRPREERQPRDDRPRDDRPRDGEQAGDRPRREDRFRDRGERRYNEPRGDRADPLAVVDPQSHLQTPLTPLAQAPLAQTPLSAPVQQTPLSAPVQQTPLSAPVRQTPLTPLAAAPAPVVAAPAPAPVLDEAGEPVKRGRGRPRKRPVEDAAEAAD